MPHRKSILSILDFDRRAIEDIFAHAGDLTAYLGEGGGLDLLRGKILATMFSEPSVRTKLSFESAMIRLGGRILGSSATEGERAHSAMQESLQDTARVMSSYADVVVVRHPAPTALSLYAQYSDIPVINGGSGQGPDSEHPTQALLDLYTIWQETNSIDGLRILLVGNPTKRAARSLVLGLATFDDVQLFLCAPKHQWFSEDDERLLRSRNMSISRVETVTEALSNVDVVYHSGQAADWQEQLSERYFITAAMLRTARTRAIVLHPLPRPGSIAVDVDDTPNARYFQASCNGPVVRMAILARMFCTEVVHHHDRRQLKETSA
jgi:aspartate carbamoyltransferase catalytic subunit